MRKPLFLFTSLLLAAVILSFLPPQPTIIDEPLPPPQPSLSYSKTEIFPGDYLVLFADNLLASDELTVKTDLVAQVPPALPYQNGRILVFAVNYRTKPAHYSLKAAVTRDGRIVLEKNEEINVSPKQFATQYLQVTASQQATRTPELAKEDAAHVSKAKSASSPDPLWQGAFIQPVEGRISTEYGLIRYINRVESGRHAGVDIAAPRGTPVKAANSGVVNLSMGLNVSGNTVIIDHGLNFFSAYSHLDTLLVQAGDSVKKGDIIGEVGSTGFSTGPHLHWTISSGLLFINPWLFLEEDPLAWLSNR